MNAVFLAVLGVGAMAALAWYSRQQARERLLAAYAQLAEDLGANYVDPSHPNGSPSINGNYRDHRFSIATIQRLAPSGAPSPVVRLELEGVPGGLRFIPAPTLENALRPHPDWTTGDPLFDRRVLVWGEEVRVRAVLTSEGRLQIAAFLAEGGQVSDGKVSRERPEAGADPSQFKAELDRLAELQQLFSLGQKENAERIKSNFHDPNLQIRKDSLEALAKAGFAWGPALTPLLNDPDIPLRIRAAELGGEDGMLKDMLQDATCKYRVEAANALSKMVAKSLPRAVMTMRELGPALAVDADRHVQLACVSASVGLGRSEGLKILDLARGTNPGPVVTLALVRAAGKLGSPGKLVTEGKLPPDHAAAVAQAESILLELLDHTDPEVQGAVMHELGRVGGGRSL
ncbi:MAG TPA: hypothetical protein PKY30_19220, partial [Myxococcota bacterium]|nr:hypothetical protein [Myxococcota bacterium]